MRIPALINTLRIESPPLLSSITWSRSGDRKSSAREPGDLQPSVRMLSPAGNHAY